MAMPPMSAAPAAADPTDDSGTDMTDPTAGAGGGDQSGDVLLTVLKNDDGTYTLIQGDEDDGADSGSTDMGAGASSDTDSSGDNYDSKGALLKAILDILNEDESSSGAAGSSEDQFQSGFTGAPAGKSSAMAQKY